MLARPLHPRRQEQSIVLQPAPVLVAALPQATGERVGPGEHQITELTGSQCLLRRPVAVRRDVAKEPHSQGGPRSPEPPVALGGDKVELHGGVRLVPKRGIGPLHSVAQEKPVSGPGHAENTTRLAVARGAAAARDGQSVIERDESQSIWTFHVAVVLWAARAAVPRLRLPTNPASTRERGGKGFITIMIVQQTQRPAPATPDSRRPARRGEWPGRRLDGCLMRLHHFAKLLLLLTREYTGCRGCSKQRRVGEPSTASTTRAPPSRASEEAPLGLGLHAVECRWREYPARAVYDGHGHRDVRREPGSQPPSCSGFVKPSWATKRSAARTV